MAKQEDETIAIYSATNFSPELAAKIFFSEHSESEVTNKLHELANLQGQIELILRQKVRENYSLFMYANREISRVGVDMNDLKHLIEDTKKILQEVRATTQPNNEMRYSRAIDKKFLPSQQQLTKASPVNNFSDTIPAWVRQAPQEIDRLIIEQQYHQAVSVIKRTLAFLESIKDLGVENLDSLSPDREIGIGAQVQKRSFHLAEILRDSLVRLPNSELWGISEKTKRLQLLVKLGHKDIAAQGFSTGQKDIIRKALRYVEASGDVEKFTSELSRVFFSHLREACTNFMELFSTSGSTKSVGTGGGTGAAGEKISPSVGEEEDSDMASLSYLVGWIQEQMSVFVAALARQIQLGAAEYRSKVFEQNVHTLRNYHQQRQQQLLAAKASRSRPGSTRMSRTPYDPFDSPEKLSSASSLTPERTLVRSSSASAAKWSRSSLGTSGYNTVRGRLASMSARDLASLIPISMSTDGPLTFTSRCLQVAYKEAMVLDLLGLQAGASLSWHIIPEIKSIINSFTDDIIREMENEVLNDDWTPIRCPQPEVRFPGKATAPSRREMESNKEDSSSLKKSSSTITSLFGGVTFENEDENLEIAESNVSGVEIFTSSSYDWIVAIMTYFIGEVLCLLQVDTTSPEEMATARFSRRSMSSDFGDRQIQKEACSRIDLCELDPEIAACLLRIVVRYVRAMMNVRSRSLTYECAECFHKTVEEISVSLLPSVEDVITKGFFSDGSTLVVNPPKAVFASLRKAIDTLQREV